MQVLRLAGLYDKYVNQAGEEVHTFTILTVDSSDKLTWLHDRMPAFLIGPEAESAWLGEEGAGGEKATANLSKLVAQVQHVSAASNCVYLNSYHLFYDNIFIQNAVAEMKSGLKKPYGCLFSSSSGGSCRVNGMEVPVKSSVNTAWLARHRTVHTSNIACHPCQSLAPQTHSRSIHAFQIACHPYKCLNSTSAHAFVRVMSRHSSLPHVCLCSRVRRTRAKT